MTTPAGTTTRTADPSGPGGQGPASGWTPLLGSELAEQARQRVTRIERDLLAARPPGVAASPSLGDGSAGLALAHHYLAATGAPGHRRRAQAHLEHALRRVRQERSAPTLFGGFVGVAWAVEHLGTGADRLAAVDDALERALRTQPWPWQFDLISGLAGIGCYALQRLPRPSAARLCELVVDQLAGCASQRRDGVAWPTPAGAMPARLAAEFPRGYDNLGLAHGAPGPVAFLGGCCAAGVARERAEPLLHAGVTWLLRQGSGTAGARFPRWREPGRRPDPSRTAWCYGDPGVAVALLHAGRGTDREDWSALAVEIAVDAAARPLEETGVVDAGMCHGAAGLAQLFHRMHRLTGEPALATAARLWLRRTIELPDPDHDGFLAGRAGVALALLAAVGDTDPGWDGALALSLPPQVRS